MRPSPTGAAHVTVAPRRWPEMPRTPDMKVAASASDAAATMTATDPRGPEERLADGRNATTTPVTTPDPDWLQFRDDLITHAPSLWAPVLSPRPAS